MAWKPPQECKERKCPNGHSWACTSKRCPECDEMGDVVCRKRKCKKCGHEWECYYVECPKCKTKNWPLEDSEMEVEDSGSGAEDQESETG